MFQESVSQAYQIPDVIETREDAHRVLRLYRTKPNPLAVLAKVMDQARENGWVDIIVQTQLALGREKRRAATGHTGRD